MHRLRFAIGLVAATAPLALAPGAIGQENMCFDDWSVAAPIVRAEGLLTVERLSPLVQSKLGAKIVKATLCLESGNYVFQLVVRSAEGRLRRLTVDARTPFEP